MENDVKMKKMKEHTMQTKKKKKKYTLKIKKITIHIVQKLCCKKDAITKNIV
jgi:hypothetical protein